MNIDALVLVQNVYLSGFSNRVQLCWQLRTFQTIKNVASHAKYSVTSTTFANSFSNSQYAISVVCPNTCMIGSYTACTTSNFTVELWNAANSEQTITGYRFLVVGY
jgi:hypothetical protein